MLAGGERDDRGLGCVREANELDRGLGWVSEVVGVAVVGPNSRPVVRVRRAAWNPRSRGARRLWRTTRRAGSPTSSETSAGRTPSGRSRDRRVTPTSRGIATPRRPSRGRRRRSAEPRRVGAVSSSQASSTHGPPRGDPWHQSPPSSAAAPFPEPRRSPRVRRAASTFHRLTASDAF